jgi:hypothetical protein
VQDPERMRIFTIAASLDFTLVKAHLQCNCRIKKYVLVIKRYALGMPVK